jgi:hypothetical protein
MHRWDLDLSLHRALQLCSGDLVMTREVVGNSGYVSRTCCDLFWGEVQAAVNPQVTSNLPTSPFEGTCRVYSALGRCLELTGQDERAGRGPNRKASSRKALTGSARADQEVKPVIVTPKYYLIHVQRYGMYFIAVVQREVRPWQLCHARRQVERFRRSRGNGPRVQALGRTLGF